MPGARVNTKLSSPRRYMASGLSDSAALVRSCIAFLTWVCRPSEEETGSSWDKDCRNDNDLRISNTRDNNRIRTEDDDGSELSKLFAKEVSICIASSTRN
jgi:hypothetical protein